MQVEEPVDGLKKSAVKYYYYIQQGLNMLNLFRNLFYIIGIGYIALKLQNPLVMAPVFLIALFLLCCLGWLDVNHMKKIMEYFSVKKATTYGHYGYKLQEEQINLLKQVLGQLKKINKEKIVDGQNNNGLTSIKTGIEEHDHAEGSTAGLNQSIKSRD